MGVFVVKLSVRIEGTRDYSGQYSHDFRVGPQPSYINASISASNVTLMKDLKSASQLIRGIDIISEKLNKRKYQKNSPYFYDGIITFDKEFGKVQNGFNKKALDECAKDFVERFCEKYNIDPLYLIRHEDETTTHYHFKTTAMDQSTGKSIARDLNNRTAKSALQDLAGSSFAEVGIERGISRMQRLRDAAEELGYDHNEGDDFHQEVWKHANVVHRSVKQLHETLPLELAKAKAEVEVKKEEIETESVRLTQQLTDLNAKMLREEGLIVDLLKKIDDDNDKTVKAYRKRLKKTEDERDEAEKELNKRNNELKERTGAILKILDSDSLQSQGFTSAQEVFSHVAEIKSVTRKQADFINKQLFKHKPVFGVELKDLDDIEDFIDFYDQDTCWIKYSNGVSGKFNEDPKMATVKNGSDANKAKSLLDTAQNAKFSTTEPMSFKGDNNIFKELYIANEGIANEGYFELRLTTEQQEIANEIKNGMQSGVLQCASFK